LRREVPSAFAGAIYCPIGVPENGYRTVKGAGDGAAELGGEEDFASGVLGEAVARFNFKFGLADFRRTGRGEAARSSV